MVSHALPWLNTFLGGTGLYRAQFHSYTGSCSAEINSPGDSIITELERAEIWWQNILPSEPYERFQIPMHTLQTDTLRRLHRNTKGLL